MRSFLQSVHQEFRHWLTGVRFYIAFASALITVQIWWWANAAYAHSSLVTIRMEQAYAWLAVILLCGALLIGPINSIWRHLPGRNIMFDARRLIGISAAWFSALHIWLAFFVQLKGPNLLSLPITYQQSFLQGIVAFLALFLMAVTSFDAAQRRLGVWWFRLHRLIYAAVVLVLFHAFTIGTHASNLSILIALTAVAVIVLGMHAYLFFVRQNQPTIWQLLMVSLMFLLLLAVFNYGFGQHLGYNPIEGKHAHHDGP